MQTNAAESFEGLVKQYLGAFPPPGLTGNRSLSCLSPETKNFITRALQLMQRSGYAATDFNPALFRWLTVTVPGILPSAWGGRIPPLTLPGRHRKLDHYVRTRFPAPGRQTPLFLDVGCGFPPVTPADTARHLPEWQIYGVDRSFAPYVLYDRDGHYACFDEKGAFQYFQATTTAGGRALYADPQAARNRFSRRFEDLWPLLSKPGGVKSETAEKDGCRLIYNHIRNFETDNLTFIESGLATLQLPPVQVIRCMNVLLYFAPDTRGKMLRQAGKLLAEDGILIAGTNGLGIQHRYAVYRKDKAGLVLDAFAFSLDNLGHIVFMPFFTLHDNDPEAMLLAELAGAIRSDPAFWPAFGTRQNQLLRRHDICLRGEDGCLHFPGEEMPPGEYLEKHNRLWRQMQTEGYHEKAVAVLNRAGYKARPNAVGDIAVQPSDDKLFPSGHPIKIILNAFK